MGGYDKEMEVGTPVYEPSPKAAARACRQLAAPVACVFGQFWALQEAGEWLHLDNLEVQANPKKWQLSLTEEC